MNNEIISQKNFKRELLSEVPIENVLIEVAQIYTPEEGWEIGDFHIENEEGIEIPYGIVSNEKKYIVIPLTQYGLSSENTNRR